MDTPRSGFRRAAIASWTLAGLGVAGVAGTSALAYADTFKPPAAHATIVAVDPSPSELGTAPVPDLAGQLVQPPVNDAPPAPSTTVTVDSPPLVVPETTVEQAPRETPTPEYTPQQTHEPTAAPETRKPLVPSTPPTTKRRTFAPSTVMAPNYSPPITMSHGS